jgi:hypothetical protein
MVCSPVNNEELKGIGFKYNIFKPIIGKVE